MCLAEKKNKKFRDRLEKKKLLSSSLSENQFFLIVPPIIRPSRSQTASFHLFLLCLLSSSSPFTPDSPEDQAPLVLSEWAVLSELISKEPCEPLIAHSVLWCGKERESELDFTDLLN